MVKDARYTSEKLPLVSGDILAMYTDGVVELTDQVGVAFGVERLTTALHQGRDLPAVELIQMIIQATQQYSGSQSYLDDFTLVIIKRL
jgi:sigma-B regulation protein RsbU (phosphoserine phosphatase)